jgi:6,7-dimethyl-8-ribityllumazine synthase
MLKKSQRGKVAIIKAEFNSYITDRLLKEAEKTLKKHKVRYDVFIVPGCFEIPFMLNKLSKKYSGFVALGCLIKGETLHFEIIAHAVCAELMDLAQDIKKPIGFGILTLFKRSQADARIKNARRAAEAVLQLL